MAARLIIGGGDCLLGCVDPRTGKSRKALPHSKTGICPVCLSNLSQKRQLSAPKLVMFRTLANTTIARCDEVKQFPKGYAKLGGRYVGKRK